MQGLRVLNLEGLAPTAEEHDLAHRVANRYQDAQVGTVEYTDTFTGIYVRFHPFKLIAFTQSSNKVYFGYGQRVDFKCPCRAIQLIETAAPNISVSIQYENIVNTIPSSCNGGENRTHDVVARVGGIEVGRVSGYVTSLGGISSPAECNAFVQRDSVNIISHAANSGLPKPSPYAIYTTLPTFNQIGTPGNYVYTIDSWNDSWSTPFDAAINAAIEAAIAEANPRAAAFLTDGTELASAPQALSAISEAYEPTFVGVPWNGGNYANLFNYFQESQFSVIYVDGGRLEFEVPEDACYIKRSAPAYPGSNGQRPSISSISWHGVINGNTQTFSLVYKSVSYPIAIGTRTFISGENTYSDWATGYVAYSWDENSGTFLYNAINGGYADRSQITAPIPAPYLQDLAAWNDANAAIAAAAAEFEANWNTAQAEALNRTRIWRKKCSDGRISMLRNGILPIEFEYFTKRYHPRSLKLRRDIPMQVAGPAYNLISDVTTSEPTIRTRVYEGVVTLQYTNTDENGGTNQVVETFTGNLTHLLTTHTEAITEVTTTSNTYTYSNFPMLSNTTGDAYPLPGSPPEHPYQIAFREINAIIRDSSQYPLFLEANGTVVQSDWYANDKYAAANYIQSDYNPPIPQSSDNVALTHPQFIYDYIEASKPIEFETVDGIKQPVTPSTNWLSSRLTDKEIVTIIPLSFTTNEGEERGMFPYTTTPTDSEYELLTNIKLYGFARFQFNYATSTFTFKDWTEFTAEGKVKVSDSIEHSFNDEINPTALTIGDKTYTLEPIVIDCEEDWLGTNCVFIGDKTPWTDVKEDAKEQTSHIGNSPPEGYELTAEERLYKAIREAIK